MIASGPAGNYTSLTDTTVAPPDRPARCYETVLLLTRSERYYFDASVLRERSAARHQRPGRDVWTIRPAGHRGDHTARMPEDLASKCVLAGSPPGAWVLDPFARTGTTELVAVQHGRSATLIELNEGYAKDIRKRLGGYMEDVASSGKARR